MSINQDATPGQGEQLPVVDQRLRVKLDGSYGSRLEGQWFFLQPADEYASRALECHTGKAAPIAQAAPSQPRNRYGVDALYFHTALTRALRDFEHFKPDELARTLARLAKVADETVLAEPEFTAPSQPEQSAMVLMPKEPTDKILAAMKRQFDKSPALWCRYRGACRAAIDAALSAQGGEA